MNITKLTAENVKRLKAVEIVPDGSTVIIGGKNAQGKTSVLDSIVMALGGKEFVPERPIRDGESSASIVLETQEFTVTRKFSASGGSTLVVTNKEGVKLGSPQGVLDALTARIAFDPLQFTRMDRKQCAETLRKLLGLDFTAEDAEAKQLYDNRTTVNRDAANAKARLVGIPRHDGVPDAVVSVASLTTKLSEAMQTNAKNDADRQELARKNAQLKNCESEMEKIRAEIERLAQRMENGRAECAKLSAARDAFAANVAAAVDIDTNPIHASIANAEATNAKVRSNINRATWQEEAERLTKQSDALTAKIDAIAADKAKKMAAAKFPVDGLSLTADGVHFKGVPLEQSSSAEQLRVSLAIACALNPKMKVMLIRDGSLLDEDSMRLVKEAADANGAQVWIEVVGDRADCSVIIEDGCVK